MKKIVAEIIEKKKQISAIELIAKDQSTWKRLYDEFSRKNVVSNTYWYDFDYGQGTILDLETMESTNLLKLFSELDNKRIELQSGLGMPEFLDFIKIVDYKDFQLYKAVRNYLPEMKKSIRNLKTAMDSYRTKTFTVRQKDSVWLFPDNREAELHYDQFEGFWEQTPSERRAKVYDTLGGRVTQIKRDLGWKSESYDIRHDWNEVFDAIMQVNMMYLASMIISEKHSEFSAPYKDPNNSGSVEFDHKYDITNILAKHLSKNKGEPEDTLIEKPFFRDDYMNSKEFHAYLSSYDLGVLMGQTSF